MVSMDKLHIVLLFLLSANNLDIMKNYTVFQKLQSHGILPVLSSNINTEFYNVKEVSLKKNFM